MTFTWLVLFIVLVLVELMTVNLLTLWFALGAIASFFVSLVCDNVSLQMGVFVLVSVISLVILRNILMKVKNKKMIPTNLDRVIGDAGIVTEEINPFGIGEVKVDGKRWSAISDKKIEVNSKVRILAIEGVKLKCQKIEEKN